MIKIDEQCISQKYFNHIDKHRETGNNDNDGDDDVRIY